MTKERFRKLLAPIKQDLSSGSVRVDKAVKMFKNAKGKEREKFFNAILEYTRFDVAEALIDQKVFTEEELYNLALQVKLYDLRIPAGEHVHDKFIKPEALATKAILELNLSDSKEFYSDLVDLLKQEKELGLLEPNKQNLENLYLELLREGNKEALKELHAYLGYKTGKDVVHSEKLATALEDEKFDEAMKLISQGHLITDLSFMQRTTGNNRIKVWKFLSSLSNHPNIDVLTPVVKKSGGRILPDLMRYNMLPEFKTVLETEEGRAALAIKYGLLTGDTILHHDLSNSTIEFAQAILETEEGRAVLVIQDSLGRTPLYYAITRGNAELVNLILETAEGKAALAIQNKDGYTPLHIVTSLSTRDINALKVMLKTAEGKAALAIKDNDGYTPLHIAVRDGEIDALKVMLETAEGKAALAIKGMKGLTPLHLASMYGNEVLVKLILDSTDDKQAALAAAALYVATPLNFATSRGSAEVVKVLLEYGAIPSFTDIIPANKLPPELCAKLTTLYKEAWKSRVYNCWSAIKGAAIMYSGDISKAYEQEDEKTHAQKQSKNQDGSENRGRE